MMKLDYIQQQTLLQFIKNKGVEHIDIQQVIYNQMEEKILNILNKNPEKDFSLAINEAYQSYGLFGFDDTKSALFAESNKNYTAENWMNVLTYIKTKKVSLTILVVTVLYVFLDKYGYDSVIKFYGWFCIILGGIIAIYLGLRHIKSEQKYSFQNRWYSLFFITFYFNVYLFNFFARNFFEKNIYFTTTVLSFGLIYSTASFEYYLKKINQKS